MSGWQPIETAPDEQLVLVAIKYSDEPVLARWYPGRGWMAATQNIAVECGVYCLGGIATLEYGAEPVAWAPIPEPPK